MSLDEHSRALAASLAKAGLAPNGPASALLPPAAPFEPTTELRVSFRKSEAEGEEAGKAVQLGTFFRAGECGRAPIVSFAAEEGVDADASYLLVLTDPDAPTPDDPKFAFWRHWVVGGLRPGRDIVAAAAPAPVVLTEYLGPGPKDDSRPHRYLFLLYREPADLALSKGDVGGEEFVQRRSFRPAEFAAKNGLKLVAVNWMTCAGDGWEE